MCVDQRDVAVRAGQVRVLVCLRISCVRMTDVGGP